MMKFRIIQISLLLFIIRRAQTFEHHNIPTLDPSIPTVAPHEQHENSNSESCTGQCAFTFIDQIRDQLGTKRTMSLLQLNYNDFLHSFANTSFFEGFCKIYHTFEHCASKCEPGFLHELLMRSSEIIDHYCVFNYDAIRNKFPCLERVEPQADCVRVCTSHHDAVTSLINNFKHLALSGDSTQAEKYLAESCEYVTCTLHCDVPAIANTCGFDTANLVIDLTRKSFGSMEKLALDTSTVSKWPRVCSDIKTYRLPTAEDIRPPKLDRSEVVASNSGSNSNFGPGPDLILLPVEVPRF